MIGKIKVYFNFYILEMLTCPYNLQNDTVEGLVNKLTKAINLNSYDCDIVTSKLYDSIQNYKYNKREKYNKFLSTIF